MPAETQTPQSQAGRYRAARRAFIAACEAAHVDSVARLHPGKAPDAKPLFMDCAALGPRRAAKGMLVAGYDAPGTDILIALLREMPAPKDARLVLVHALDPAAFAGVAGDPSWPRAMLGAVATEDLSRVRALGVLALGREDPSLARALQASLSGAIITILPPASSAMEARAAVTAFLAD
ncbi:MAG TPA: DUF2817 domain-containing protein [Rhizomicrobium sp.]|nr:DUF2817 domain-containing protein [Rhizomicrobium sp.]